MRFILIIFIVFGSLGCSEEDECGPQYVAYCKDESHITVCDIESPGNDSATLSWYTRKCSTGTPINTPYCVSTQGTAVCSSSTLPDPNCSEALSYSGYCSGEETIQRCTYNYPTTTISCSNLGRFCVDEPTDRATCKPEPVPQP